MADLRILQGRPENAVAWIEKALRLNLYPAGWYYWTLGFAYYAAGRYAESVDALRKEEVGRLPAKRILAASLAQLGRMDEAREEVRRFLDINPGFLHTVGRRRSRSAATRTGSTSSTDTSRPVCQGEASGPTLTRFLGLVSRPARWGSDDGYN